MEKYKSKIFSIIFIILISLLTVNISKAEDQLTSNYYKIDSNNKIISRIYPKTTIDEFKEKIDVKSEQIKIYNKETNEEITEGYVATGMFLKCENNSNTYELSVVGDLNKDGDATQIELTQIIRYIVGLEGSNLEGIYYESADITGDGLVDQRDITKIIRYVVYGELDLGKVEVEKKDTTPPEVISGYTLKQTSNEVIYEQVAQDLESGIKEYVFYLKKIDEPDTCYVEKQRGINSTVQLDGLEDNTTYLMLIEIYDNMGNKSEDWIKFTTPKIPDGNEEGSIIFGTEEWNNGTASLEISTSKYIEDFKLDTGVLNEKYQIEYQVNETNGTWTKGTKVTGLKYGDLVYARLTDGTNSGNYVTLTVVDAVKPNVQLNLQAQNQEITATASATDNESGIDTNANYTFYIKETSQPDSSYVQQQNTTSATCSFTNLTVGNNYTVKVEVEDKAGNKGAIEKSIEIPDDIAPVVSLSVTGKTSDTVTVQATATDVGGLPTPTIYKFYIKETGADDSTYVETQNSENAQCTFIGLEQNKDYTVKVTVADKAGNVGKKETSIVTDQIPDATDTGAITFGTPTWNNGQAEVTITTNTSYQIEYQVNGTTGTWTKGATVTGLNHNDVIYARLTDSKNTSNHATLTVVDTVKPNVQLNLQAQNQEITATASATDNESGIDANANYTFYIKEINQPDSSYVQQQNTTSATCSFTNLTVGNNYTVKVEVEDKAGNKGTIEKSIEIPDDIAPVVSLSVTGKTSNTVTVQATVTDVGGLPTSTIYKFYIKETGADDRTYVETQNSENAQCTFTGLEQNKDYTVKVTVADEAGNVGEKETSIVTDQIPDATDTGAITFGTPTWNDGQAEVTITTKTSYQIEYQINRTTGTWTKGATVTGLNHNDVIYARLTDGKNTSNHATLTVVDTVKPNVQLNLQAQNQEITATASATDNESGIDANANYIFYIKETNQPDSSYVQQQNTTSATCSFTNLTVGNNYTVKVEVEDKAGNKGTIEKSIEIPDDIAPVVSLSVTGKASNTVTVQATATDVGGLPTPTIYKFYIKETGADDSTYVETQNSENAQCTFIGLEQNKDYTVKVTVADEAGNVGEKETSIVTDQIPDATDTGAITFGTPTWNDGQAEVTITTKTSYQIEYQVNGTTRTWIKGTTVTGLNHNDVIYARLTDGKNTSNHATLTVLDSTEPQVALSLTADTSKVTAIANAVDNETGLETNPIYTFYIKETSQPDSSYIEKQKTTSNTCDITGLEQSKNYTVKVEVEDIAGNTGSKQETISTKTIPDETTEGAIKFGATIWNNEKAEVAISTNTTFKLEYQVNGTEGTWTAGTTVTGLEHNDVVYARLTDGTNAGEYATLIIADTTEPEEFTISVTDIGLTSLKTTGSTIDNESGLADYTYVAVSSTGSEIKYENQTATSYNMTGLELGTEYKVYMLAYDNAGNVRKSNEVTVRTREPEIIATAPYIGTSTTKTDSTQSVDDNSQTRGTTLYINFSATIEGTNCTIEPTVPYAVTSNGKYKFTVTGTYQNKTITKEIEVAVDQYQAAQRLVQYDAGDWTEEEINSLKASRLYDINGTHEGNDTFFLKSALGYNFTFGGFTYKGKQIDTTSGEIITSRNQSVSPSSGFGTPKYDGWQVLESIEENGKTYVTKLVHAGTPENFVYYYTSTYDSYRAEYLLSNGERQTDFSTLSGGTAINPRSWEMYKDKELDSKGYIKDVHAMTYDEAYAITGSDSSTSGIRNTESYYWLADANSTNNLWAVYNDGSIGRYNGSRCWGVRPVVSLNSGVYIASGSGTGADPYILGIE